MSKQLGYIDFAAVKAAVSLEQVLEHYGILEKLHPSGEKSFRGCCPIHNGVDPDQFCVTPARNLWNCFSECKHGGNQLDFVMAMEDCSLAEAAWKVNEWFELGQERKAAERPRSSKSNAPAGKGKATQTDSKSKEPPAEAQQEPPPEPEEETGENKPLPFSLQNLDPTHPYLVERGLTPETIEEFGLGYCSRGILAGRIAIPIHNSRGELVANAGRWPGDPPEGKEKYRLPGGFRKTLELFNANRAFNEPTEQPLVIVKDFFVAMHLWQLGVRRVIALMGSSLSMRQEEIIAQTVSPQTRIVLMLDNDEAGQAAMREIVPRLAQYCFVRCLRYPDGVMQPDSLAVDQLAEHLA